MIKTVYGPQDVLRRYAEKGLFNGRAILEESSTCVGYIRDGKLCAVMVYHNWNHLNGVMELSGYSNCRTWANKRVTQEVFSYPFKHPGVRLLVGRHSENNRRVRRIWRALGAQEYIIPELRGPGEAECVAVLSKEAWKKFEARL